MNQPSHQCSRGYQRNLSLYKDITSMPNLISDILALLRDSGS